MVCLVVALSANVVCAATVDTQVTRVALFKNGLAFFSREGALPARPGEIEIGPLPAASHGTFWLGWSPQAKIANLSSREVEVAESRLALTIPSCSRPTWASACGWSSPPSTARRWREC